MKHASRQLPAVVYKITNLLNGKFYIGVTTRQQPIKRFKEHMHAAKYGGDGHFYRAIRKHGRSVFVFDILTECESGAIALEEEIRLIAELRPPYNSTLGGEGQRGRKFSQDALRRIGAAHIGNTVRRGKKHNPETVELLRQLGLERKDLFAEFSPMGPRASSKRVRCLDDGLEFDSASAAARHYGVAKSAIIELCNGYKSRRRTVGGMVFQYITEEVG